MGREGIKAIQRGANFPSIFYPVLIYINVSRSKPPFISPLSASLPENVYDINNVRIFPSTSASLASINGTIDRGLAPAIYLDLDGVLVDFTTSAAVLLDNMQIPRQEDGLIPESYIKKQVAREALFDICSGREFWENLPPYPWAWMLFEECFRLTQGNVYFTSLAYREDPLSWAGKAAWVHRHFGEYGLNRLFQMTGSNKHMLCRGRQDIMIDDYLDNVCRWALAGGIGFHWREIDSRYGGAAEIVAKRFSKLQQLFSSSSVTR